MSFNNRAGRQLQAGLEKAQAAGVDPDVLEALSASVEMFKRRDEFTIESTSDSSDTLAKIHENTFNHDWQADFDEGKFPKVFKPVMITGPLQGQLLKSLVSMQGAKRILEVGLFTGYGALSMAEALPADGEIVSLEICESLKTLATEFAKDSNHARKIRVEVGPALETAKKLSEAGEKFDMMFLDGDKKDYFDLVKMAFDDNLLNEGGTMLIDNAFGMGSVFSSDPSDSKTVAYELQEALKAKADLHKVLLPINDGVLMVRRMKDVERDSA